MAVSEQALDPTTFTAKPGNPSFVLGNSHLRSNWNYSFFLGTPNNQHLQNFVGYLPPGLIGFGSTGGTPPASDEMAFQVGAKLLTSGPPYFMQAYVDSTGKGTIVGVSSTSVAFPVGSIPICFFTLDGVFRCQAVTDSRNSFLSSIPATGSLTEVIASPTLRGSLAASFSVPRTFALSREIRPDVDLPTTSFLLGGGTVNNGSGNVVTPTTLISCSIPPPRVVGAQPFLQISPGVNYIFCDQTTGALSTNVTGFQANSLNICTVTVDSASLIRQISDQRNSYI